MNCPLCGKQLESIKSTFNIRYYCVERQSLLPLNISHYTITYNFNLVKKEVRLITDKIIIKSFPMNNYSQISLVRNKRPYLLIEKADFIDLENVSQESIDSIEKLLIFL